MPAPTSLRAQLQRDEGCRLKVYTDSLGHPTIGYGRALDTKGISLREAEAMLDSDITDATSDVVAALPWTMGLDEVRREALVNMAFNLGTRGLLGFKRFLAAVQAGRYAEAARHGLDSKWHAQVGVRAERLMKQIETGERQ